MESELYTAIARFSVEDIEALDTRPQRIGDRATDRELAVRLAREEAANLRRFNQDRALAQSLAAGVARDVGVPVGTRLIGPRLVLATISRYLGCLRGSTCSGSFQLFLPM